MADMKRNRVSWVSCAVSDAIGACGSGSPRKETAVLVGWRRRSDNHVLVRMKTEAILYASEGVGIGIIAKMVERAERTVQEWLADWQATRMRRVPAGHAGNRDAAKPARAQKEELETILARPPSPAGVHAGFWDVPAIRDAVKTLSDAEHQSDSSYQLLLRLCGPNLEPPGPVRRAPQQESRHQTHGLGDDPGQGPVGSGLGGVRGRRGPLGARGLDPPHAAPERTTHQTVRGPEEDVPVLLRRPPPTSRTVTPYPTEQNQNTEQTTLAPDLLQRETGTGKTAVVPDNARPHHARALTDLHEPGRLLERITPVFLPPYAPDHNPVEHVRNAAKNNIATIQHETPEETLGASASHITGRTFDHDFEHLPTPRNQKRFCFMTAIAIENNIEETVDLELKRPSTLIGSNSPTIIGNQSGTMRPPRISLQWRTPAAVGLFSECLKMASIIPPRDLRQSPGMQIPSNAYFESRMRGSARPSSD